VCNITRVTPKLDTALSNIQGMVTDLNLYGCYGRCGYRWTGKSPWEQKIMRTQLVRTRNIKTAVTMVQTLKRCWLQLTAKSLPA